MRQILPFVNINGKIVHQKYAQISIFNEGSLYGIGIFTTIKVREGVPLFLDSHLHRLQTNTSQLQVHLEDGSPELVEGHDSPEMDSQLQNAIHATIKKNNLAEGGIRITLTPDTTLIHAFTIKQFNNETIKLITLPDPRDMYKTIKMTYRAPHLLAQKQAQTKNAHDAIFTQNNKLIESTNANIFASISNNIIITPPIKTKGINGISRQILMQNLPIQEQDIPADTTDPIVLVNSLSIRVVKSIDGRRLKQNSQFITTILHALESAEKSYINSPCHFEGVPLSGTTEKSSKGMC